LPTNKAPATVIKTTISAVKIALPITTMGWRTRREWRLGAGILSGSRAARGLRGNDDLAADGPFPPIGG